MNKIIKSDFIVVGGGIVGLATAYKLQLKFPKKTILILEKESEIGMHQTGRNSGVIHSGIYYTPNSYKAKNCRKGREQLVAFAEKFGVKFETCGKIIVATSEKEVPILNSIFEKGIQNNTPGIQFLNSDEIKDKEPFIEGVKAIWVPTAGIIDYVGLCHQFVQEIKNINNKSKVILNCEVDKQVDGVLKTISGEFIADKIIFCTGLFADRIAKKTRWKLIYKLLGLEEIIMK